MDEYDLGNWDDYDFSDWGSQSDTPDWSGFDFSGWETPDFTSWNPDSLGSGWDLSSPDFTGWNEWQLDTPGIYEAPTISEIDWATPEVPYGLTMGEVPQTADWGSLFQVTPTALDVSSLTPGSSSSMWSDIQSIDPSLTADLAYGVSGSPSLSFADRASELQILEDMGVINSVQKDDLMSQLREQYDTQYTLTPSSTGSGAFYESGLASGKEVIPNITVMGSSKPTWNPDIGWVDAQGNKVEVPQGYGMTQGIEGPDTSWDTANGLGQTAKSLGITWDPDRGWVNVGGEVFTPDPIITTLEGDEAITDSSGRILATRNPITGEVTRFPGADANQPTTKDKYYQDLIDKLTKQTEALVNATKTATGTTTQPRTTPTTPAQPSKVQGALNIAQSVLRMLEAATGKNVVPTQARSSTVQSMGPTAQAARPTRTLYAKGGKVELPQSVMGGLLPITLKIAEHMMDMGSGRHQGLIEGEGGGQDDVVDIRAAPGEYVMDAEIVSAIGDGNNSEGAKKLDKMRYNIRKHKRTGGLTAIAPKAKSPEQYLKGK